MSDINKELIGKKYEELHPIGNFPNELTNIILNFPNDLSPVGLKFLMLLECNLKEEQIIKKKHEKSKNAQLVLFDTKLFDIDDDSNQTKYLKFHYSDFLATGNKNYIQVKKGIDELMNFEYSVNIDLNKSIENQASYKPDLRLFKSRLILNTIQEPKRGFKILIDKFCYRLLINLTDGYNPFIKSVIFNFKSNYSFKFYLWLIKLPLIKEKDKVDYKGIYETLGEAATKLKGTSVKLDNFINTLKIPFKYESQIARDYLDVIRADLNKCSNISFNYKFENKKVYIVSYPGNKALIAEGLFKPETIKIKSTINYKVKAYQLEQIEALILVDIYINFGYDFVHKATDKKKSLRGLVKREYVAEFHKLVNQKLTKSNLPLQVIGYSDEDKLKIRNELFKKFGDKNIEKNSISIIALEEKYPYLKKK